jgi:hypothetical protein
LQQAIVDLCDLLGIALSPEQHGHLTSLDLASLDAFRAELKARKQWPA